LFGINIASLYSTVKLHCSDFSVTAIDPLSGYYGEDRPIDERTGVPVSADVFMHNMRVNGVEKEQISLIQELSTNIKAKKALGDRKYNYFIIDGDHSYEGAKYDFDNYLSCVEAGGYILFDDYNTSEWPDIKKYVDEDVKMNPDVEWVGSSWRTAVFRKK
jgi:hypothetical protein